MLCDEPVEAGEEEGKWGMWWGGTRWVHYHCIEQIHEAMLRVRDNRIGTKVRGVE